MFFPCPASKDVGKSEVFAWKGHGTFLHELYENNQYRRIHPPGSCLDRLWVDNLKFSAQTEQFCWVATGTNKTSSRTGNENGYYGLRPDSERMLCLLDHRTTSQHNTTTLKLFFVVRSCGTTVFWTRTWSGTDQERVQDFGSPSPDGLQDFGSTDGIFRHPEVLGLRRDSPRHKSEPLWS